jgi:hypothetical protein
MRVAWLDRLNVSEQPSLPEVAIALADEGVPLACIARATRIPSDELRDHLLEAREAGRLIDLPRHDWAPHNAPECGERWLTSATSKK